MPIPSVQHLLRPVLVASSSRDIRVSDVIDLVSGEFGLSQSERQESNTKSGEPTISYRTWFATVDLRAAGLITRPARGVVRATPKGVELLKQQPEITYGTLRQQPEYQVWLQSRRSKVETDTEIVAELSPLDILQETFDSVQESLVLDVMKQLTELPPSAFERVMTRLLAAMGYGGPNTEARVVGGPGDGGIDAVVNQDPLGLDIIYVQAKRWTSGSIGRGEVQAFVGSLAGRQATKGLFVTTSRFTQEAKDYVRAGLPQKVILIDGPGLANLMIQYGVGVTEVATFKVQRIDEDFFDLA